MRSIRLAAGLLAWTMSYGVVAESAQPDTSQLEQEARQLIQSFAATLQTTLKSAIAEGGLTKAVSVCQIEAPNIAGQVAAEGWTVGRTSLRERNPENRPDDWELAQLQSFEEQHTKGVAVPLLKVAEVIEENDQRKFRYMQAIPTQGLCLACHGSQLATDVQTILAERYPSDRAVGFSEGDLRGAFTLTRTLP